MTVKDAITYCRGLAKMAHDSATYLQANLDAGKFGEEESATIVDGLLYRAQHDVGYVVAYGGEVLEPKPRYPKPGRPDIPPMHEIIRRMQKDLNTINEHVAYMSVQLTDARLHDKIVTEEANKLA